MPDQTTTLDLAALELAIAGTEFAGTVVHLQSVGSTNTIALEAAQAGARHGVWIADEQTAGRGRGAHTWHSPGGSLTEPAGLYLTALASPPIPLQSTLRLSFTTAIAVQTAIAATTGLRIPEQIDIRWPNDLVIAAHESPSRKVGGILIETAAHPAPRPDASGTASPVTLKYAVIGIGINLNQLDFPAELESVATSLRRELPGQVLIRREPLAAAILRNLDTQLHTLASGNSQLTSHNSQLASHSTWLTGKRVRVEARDGQPSYTGVTAGLDPQGFLRVHGDDGQIHTVLSGGLRAP